MECYHKEIFSFLGRDRSGMLKLDRGKNGYILWAIITIIIVMAAYIVLFHTWEMNGTILLDDYGDTIGIASAAQNYISGIDRYDLFNMPFGEKKASNIQSGAPYLLLLRLICLFCNSWGMAINILYFIGYPLSAICMFGVLAYLGSRPEAAAGLSIIYAFLPYHYLRGEEHLYLGMYFLIPFACLLLYELFAGAEFTKAKLHFGIILMFLLGISDIYYTVFSCILLVCAGLSGALARRRKGCFFYSLIFGAMSMLGILITNIPFLMSVLRGVQSAADAAHGRTLYDLEIFGLRIAQLILPIQGHRLSFLAELRQKYDDTILSTENSMSTLGFLISCGFVLSLFSALLMHAKSREGSAVRELGKLNIMCVLLGTVGGFNIFVGMLSASIRCYNRLSLFIGTFSVFVLAYVLQYLHEKFFSKGRTWIFCAVMAAVVFFALLDQTPPFCAEDYQERLEINENIRLLVEEIEAVSEEGDMVFMYPIIYENEHYLIGEMRPYEQRWPAMYSNRLKWSKGTSGRVKMWKQWLTAQSLEEQLLNISVTGFAGVWLDQNGYAADEFIDVKRRLDDYLGQPIADSPSGRQFYYSLAEYTAELRKEYTEAEWNDLRARSLEKGTQEGRYYGADSLYYLGDAEEDDQTAVLREGGLQYGPYIVLEAGEYVVTITGKNLGIAKFAISCDNGIVVPYNEESITAEERKIRFRLDDDAEKVEFVLINPSAETVILKYYHLTKE